MTWLDHLDPRQQKEVDFARMYASKYAHGTDGHTRLLLIARLSALLDSQAEDLRLTLQARDDFQEVVRAAIEQLGSGPGVPLPVGIARLTSQLAAARRLAATLNALLGASGRCPVCGATMDVYVGVFHHADHCPLAGFERAVKEVNGE